MSSLFVHIANVTSVPLQLKNLPKFRRKKPKVFPTVVKCLFPAYIQKNVQYCVPLILWKGVNVERSESGIGVD